MKKILLAVGLFASTLTFAQSNQPGTIHLGLGWGLQLGGANFDFTQTDPSGEKDVFALKGIGAKANYGIRAGYGLTESISAGIYLRSENAGYATILGGSLNTKGMGFGVEAKYYLVNKDKFNFYLAPSVGYSVAKSYYLDPSEPGALQANGIAYGFTGGFNWYWADFIGMSLDLGYMGGGLKAEEEISGYKNEVKIKSGGVYFGLGLVSKFGGK